LAWTSEASCWSKAAAAELGLGTAIEYLELLSAEWSALAGKTDIHEVQYRPTQRHMVGLPDHGSNLHTDGDRPTEVHWHRPRPLIEVISVRFEASLNLGKIYTH